MRWIVAGLLLSWAGGLSAQDGDPATIARSLFERGLSLAEEERFEEAAEVFERSFEVVPRASTALNWAIVLRRLERPREALRALDEFREHATEADRRDAENLRAQLRTQLVALTLSVRPARARIEVDGREEPGEGSERFLVLDPGSHLIRAFADGYLPGTLELALRAGQELREHLHLELAPRESSRRRLRRGLGFGAAAVVVLTVTIVAIALARRDSGDGLCAIDCD